MVDCNRCHVRGTNPMFWKRKEEKMESEANRSFVPNSISTDTDIPGEGWTVSMSFVYEWASNAYTSWDSFLGKGRHFLKFESHGVENERFGEHGPTVLGISSASLPPAAYLALTTSFEVRSMCERVEERLSWLWKLHFGYRRLYWGGGRNCRQFQPSNAYSFHLIKKIVLNFPISKIKNVFLHNHKIIITPRALKIVRYYYLIYKSHLISPTVRTF